MERPNINSVTTAGEAEQLAKDWQHWQSEQSMSWAESAEWYQLFKELAIKFNLTIVFAENGII